MKSIITFSVDTEVLAELRKARIKGVSGIVNGFLADLVKFKKKRINGLQDLKLEETKLKTILHKVQHDITTENKKRKHNRIKI